LQELEKQSKTMSADKSVNSSASIQAETAVENKLCLTLQMAQITLWQWYTVHVTWRKKQTGIIVKCKAKSWLKTNLGHFSPLRTFLVQQQPSEHARILFVFFLHHSEYNFHPKDRDIHSGSITYTSFFKILTGKFQ